MPSINLIPLSPKLSEQALSRYIRTFLDHDRMSVHTYMMLEKLRRNKGYRSGGHVLWDYYSTERKRRPYIISETTFKSYSHRISEVLIYWDCTYVEPSSPFAKVSGVCSARYADIAANLNICPPTLYLFDPDYLWSLARTDEAQNEMDWNCLQIGEIGSRERKQVCVPGRVFGPSARVTASSAPEAAAPLVHVPFSIVPAPAPAASGSGPSAGSKKLFRH